MSEDSHKPSTNPRKRLIILLGVLIGLFALASYFDVADRFDVEAIRAAVVDAGVWGWLFFIVVFAAGEFIHVPGLVFVAAAILAYGQIAGFLLGYVGAVISVCFSFVVVRIIGGTPFKQAQHPRLQKLLSQLAHKPVRTVIVLRLLFTMAPLLNYALAITSLRFRDYLVGSVVGLILPIGLATYFFDWLIGYL